MGSLMHFSSILLVVKIRLKENLIEFDDSLGIIK